MVGNEVIRWLPLAQSRKLFRTFKEFPAEPNGSFLFAVHRTDTGIRYQHVNTVMREQGPDDSCGYCLAVMREPRSAAFHFPDVLLTRQDDREHHWDLQINALLAFKDRHDIENLLSKGLGNLVNQNSGLDVDQICTFIAHRLHDQVALKIANVAPDGNATSAGNTFTWLQNELNAWLTPFGLGATLQEPPRLTSATHATQELARLEREREEQALARRRTELDLILQEKKTLLAFEEEKDRIEHDLSMNRASREMKLDELAQQFQMKRIMAERELEELRLAGDIARQQHALEIQRVINETLKLQAISNLMGEVEKEELLARIRTAQAQQRTAEADAAAADRRILELKEDEQVVREDKEARVLVAQLLADSHYEHRARIANRLIEEHHYTCRMLAELGVEVRRDLLLETLRWRSAENRITLKFVDPSAKLIHNDRRFATRSIGASPQTSLRAHGLANFSGRSGKRGYVTLLNFGSTGACHVHCPSHWVSPQQAFVGADADLQVPGAPIMPQADLDRLGYDYRHDGNRGYEHMALIISDAPLISSGMLAARCSDTRPFLTLDHEEMETFRSQLIEAPAPTWQCGVLTMHVSEA